VLFCLVTRAAVFISALFISAGTTIVVMLMHRFEQGNLGRGEIRFDLRFRTIHQRLDLLVFLIGSQARILKDRLHLLVFGNQDRLDFVLFGRGEGELGRKMSQLLIGAFVMMFPLAGTAGRRGARIGLGHG